MKTTGFNPEVAMNSREITTSSMGSKTDSGADRKSTFSSLLNLTQNSVAAKYQTAQPTDSIKVTTSNKMLEVKKNETSGQSNANTTGKTSDAKEVADVYTKELNDKLKDLLGLSDQEVEDLLEKLGLTAMDLFNPENLTAFVLESFGASSVEEALMNEGLSNALLVSSELLSEVVADINTEVLAELNGSKTEESFEGLLDASLQQTEGSQGENEIQVEVNKEDANSSNNKRDDLRGDAKESFIDVLANKADLTSIQPEGVTLYESKQIVSQIVEQIKLNISQTKTSMELVLNPEALGKVQVTVQSKSGVLTAHLNCENEIAKEALESSLQILKESFEAQGLKVEKVEVTIGNYTSEYAEQEGHAEEQGKRSSNKKINIDEYLEDEVDSDEKAGYTSTANINGTVEYMA